MAPTETNLDALEAALAQRPEPSECVALLTAIVSHRRADASGSLVPLAGALHRLGHAQLRLEQPDAAVTAWRDAADLLRGQGGAAADLLVDTLMDLGGQLCAKRDGAAAQQPLREATDLLRFTPPTARSVWAFNLLATAFGLTKSREDGLAALREAEHAARIVAHQTRSPRDAAGLATVLNNIGRAQLTLGRPQDACATLEDCLHVTRLLVEHSENAGHLTLHSAVSNKYGRALEQTGRLGAALPPYEEAVGIVRALVEGGRQDLAHDLHHVTADLQRLRGKLALH